MNTPQSPEEWIIYAVLLVAGVVLRHYFPALAPLLDRLRGGKPAPKPDTPAGPTGRPLLDAIREALARLAAQRLVQARQAADEELARRIETLIEEQGREPR